MDHRDPDVTERRGDRPFGAHRLRPGVGVGRETAGPEDRPLWCLHTFGRQRFVQLERRIKGITPKVLTQRLRQLERDGLAVRTYHPEVPPRVEYEISDLGTTLAPLFAHLADWAGTHLDDVETARQRYDEAGSPRP
ncbi:winged helix-turn-helix transcriptional regulator [Streptomyces sp. NPDC054813]